MSTVIAMRTELEERGHDFGRELAAALVLAGERADRDRQLMREMTAVAAGEMRKAVEWLRENTLPEQFIAEYERACRKGFQSTLHALMRDWREEQTAADGVQAA